MMPAAIGNLQGAIQIEPVANGWIVTMPCMDCINSIPDMNSIIRENAKIFRDEMNQDETLARLMSKNDPDAPVAQKRVFSDLKNKHINIFKTFDEVLEFLKNNVK